MGVIKNGLMVSAACKDGDYIWFSASNHNGLYKHCISQNVTSFIDFFPHDNLDMWKISVAALKYGDYIIFFPDRSSYIYKYDTRVGTFESCPISSGTRGGFVCERQIGNKFYFCVYGNNAEMLEFSPDEMLVKSIVIEERVFGEEIFTSTCDVKNNSIFFASKKEDAFYMFDTYSKNIEKIRISEGEGKGVGTISLYDNSIFLSGIEYLYEYQLDSHDIIKLKIPQDGLSMTVLDDGKMISIKGFKEGMLPNEKPFAFSFILNDQILYMPFRTDRIVVCSKKGTEWNVHMNESEEYEKETQQSLCRNGRLSYCHYIPCGGGFVSSTSETFYYMSGNNELAKATFLSDSQRYSRMVATGQQVILNEGSEFGLNEYLLSINENGDKKNEF